MCGIAGFTTHRHAPEQPGAALSAMTRALQHRGPDAEGAYTDPAVHLGHRRLSILDLAGGAQPMSSADGRWHIVFNGEIYNYLELRRDLEARGAPSGPNPTRKFSFRPGRKTGSTVCPASTACLPLPSGIAGKNASPSPGTRLGSNLSITPTTGENFSFRRNSAPSYVSPDSSPGSTPPRSTSTSLSAISLRPQRLMPEFENWNPARWSPGPPPDDTPIFLGSAYRRQSGRRRHFR